MERLISLPFKKSLEIAFQSLKVRFFRSLITTASLVLAVAFLCYSMLCNDLATGVLLSGEPQMIEKLIQQGYDITKESSSIGESPKQQWLLILSLLVCVVGIVNAQLMAVTERFREIGTMKCLGALDHIILRLFLLEAALQGIIGACIGSLLGLLTAIANTWLTLGSAIFTSFPVREVLFTLGQSVLIGCFLSLCGVIFPAIKAARMAPVEAMRVDQ